MKLYYVSMHEFGVRTVSGGVKASNPRIAINKALKQWAPEGRVQIYARHVTDRTWARSLLMDAIQ